MSYGTAASVRLPRSGILPSGPDTASERRGITRRGRSRLSVWGTRERSLRGRALRRRSARSGRRPGRDRRVPGLVSDGPYAARSTAEEAPDRRDRGLGAFHHSLAEATSETSGEGLCGPIAREPEILVGITLDAKAPEQGCSGASHGRSADRNVDFPEFNAPGSPPQEPSESLRACVKSRVNQAIADGPGDGSWRCR